MKRIILGGIFLSLSTTAIHSQTIELKEDPDQLFYLATEQYKEKEYPSCYRTIETWFKKSENNVLVEEALFLRAASAYELNKKETSLLLIQFLEEFPVSPHASKAYYLLGCCALNAEEYSDAMEFFDRCPMQELTQKEQLDYKFRLAYTSLQLSDYESARRLFGELASGNSRYVGSATYFYAYMDYSEGKMKDAMAGFQKIAKHAQYKEAVPYFNLQLLYIEGKLDEMLEQADKLMDRTPTMDQKKELIRLTGAAWFDKKEFAKSHKFYQEYLSFNPKLLRSDQFRIGVNYYSEKKYDTALDFLSKVMEPNDALTQSAIYHQGLCYLKQNKNDMARMSFEQASLKDFDKATKEKALYNYALLCYEMSFSPFNEQVKAFQRILTEFPNSEFADEVYGYLAEVFLSSKEYEQSLQVIQKIAKPDNKLLKTKSRLLFLLAVEKYNGGLYKEATDLLTNAIDLSEKLGLSATEAYFWRGDARYNLKQYGTALLDYKKFSGSAGALTMNAYPLSNYNQAYCHFNLKKYDDARSLFEKYTAITSVKGGDSYSDALNRIGDCYFQAKNYTKAEASYLSADKALKTGSDYAVYQRAFCLGLRKQYNVKIDLLKNFSTRFQNSDYADDALFEMARTHIQLKNADLAITAFTQLMKEYPESPLSRKAGIQIALQFFNEGSKEDAIAAYKKVIEKYPGSEEARVALGDLKDIYVSNDGVNDYVDYTKGLGNVPGVQAGEQDSLSFAAAEKLLMDGKNDKAIKGFQAYLNKFPNGSFSTDSHYHLGHLIMDSDKVKALEHLVFVAGQTGNQYQAEATELIAESYYDQKDYTKALSCYQQMETLATDKSTRIDAKLGTLRCLYLDNQKKEAIEAAGKLISETGLSADILREARYYRAMALLDSGQNDKAKVDLEAIASQTQTAFGAEATFRLAEYQFKKGSSKESEKIIQKFIKEGTSQSYWLARSFVLLSDIYIQRKDDFQAKHYLLSLKENYKEANDVQEMISSRLSAIAKRIK